MRRSVLATIVAIGQINLATMEYAQDSSHRTLRRAQAAMARIEGLFGTVACAAQFAIMVIVVADVVGRYALNMPLEWVYDLISRYLMALLFFFSISWALAHGEHVRVLYFRQFIPRWLRRALDSLGALAAAGVFGMIFIAGSSRFVSDWVTGDAFSGAIFWPNWIASVMVPLGIGLMVIRLVLLAVVNAVAAFGGPELPGAADDALY